MMVWASCYTQSGQQFGVTLKVTGQDIYNEIKAHLVNGEEVADYGTYDELEEDE